MDNNNEINPLFIYKLLGAKQLKLKFTNLSINTKHKNNAEFNIETYLARNKGLMLMNKEIIGAYIQRNIRIDIRRKNTNITRNKDGT